MKNVLRIAMLFGILLPFCISAEAESRDSGITAREYCKGNKIKGKLVPVTLPGMENNMPDRFEILWGQGDQNTLYIFASALRCPLRLTSRYEKFIGAARHPAVLADETLRGIASNREAIERHKLLRIEEQRCKRIGLLTYYETNVEVWGDHRAGSLEGILTYETDSTISDCGRIVSAFGRSLGFFTESYEVRLEFSGPRAAFSVTGVYEDEDN